MKRRWILAHLSLSYFCHERENTFIDLYSGASSRCIVSTRAWVSGTIQTHRCLYITEYYITWHYIIEHWICQILTFHQHQKQKMILIGRLVLNESPTQTTFRTICSQSQIKTKKNNCREGLGLFISRWKPRFLQSARSLTIEVVASIAGTKLRVGLGSLTQNIWNESSWWPILGQPCQWSSSLCVWICPSWPFFVSPPIYRQPAMVSGVRRTICHIHYFVGASDMSSITKWGEEFLKILKSSTKVKLECSGKGRALLTRA